MAGKRKNKPIGSRGPLPDSATAALRELGPDWRAKAKRTLGILLEELEARREQLDAIELLGGIRTVAEALTTSEALIDPDDDGKEPGAPPALSVPAAPPRLNS